MEIRIAEDRQEWHEIVQPTKTYKLIMKTLPHKSRAVIQHENRITGTP